MIIKLDSKLVYKVLFFVWYSMQILKGTTLYSFFGIPIDTLNYLADGFVTILLLFIIIIFQSYSINELYVIAIVSCVLLISGIISGNYVMISGWLFILASKDIMIEDILNLAYFLIIFGLMMVIGLYLVGIADDFIMYRAGITRHSLGFSHPNILGMRVFQFNIFRFYRKKININIWDFLIGIASGLFVFFVSNSLTSTICIMALVIMMTINKIIEKFYETKIEIFSSLMVFIAIAFNLFSMFVSIVDENKFRWVYSIRRLFSFHLYNCNKVYSIYGPSLFGNRMYISGEAELINGSSVGRLYLDNAYMGSFMWFGIIVYILFSVSYILTMCHFKKENNVFMVIVLFVFALYGVMEQGTYIISHNVFLMAISYVVFLDKERMNSVLDERCISIIGGSKEI